MKLLIVIGTRPEAIKMAPLIKRFSEENDFILRVCNTGQHKDLLDPILNFFKIHVYYDLKSMVYNQGLTGLTTAILSNMKAVFDDFKPDFVLVHGDTTTSFAASLAAFYSGIKIAHVEAGLRTHDKYSPFPEEINRSLTAKLTDIHFSPTITAKENLYAEGIENNVFITGNTVIDALHDAINLINEDDEEIQNLKQILNFNKKIILFTGHRRENFGDSFNEIFTCLNQLTIERDDIEIVYPVHPNPNIKKIAFNFFNDNKRVHLIEPLNYGPFVWLLKQSHIILTDSGGIQEEAPSLGKPVLVLREVTERPEAVKAGTVILVGSNKEKIRNMITLLLDNHDYYNKMASINNPYGDGKASERIINNFKLLLNKLSNDKE